MTVVVLFYDIIQSDGLRYFHNDLLQAFQNFEKTLKAFFFKNRVAYHLYKIFLIIHNILHEPLIYEQQHSNWFK